MRGPDEAQFQSILRITAGDDAIALRDRAILHLARNMGLRRGELVRLSISDLDLDTNPPSLLCVAKGKTQPDRLKIPAASVPVLRDWLDYHPAKHSPESPVFIRLDRAAAEQSPRLSTEAIARIVGRRSTRAGLARVKRTASVTQR